MLALAACGDTPELGSPGYVEGFAGTVVADEAHAALLASDLLTAGGSAADAITAAFFALTVTKPASAGLMASGLCLLYDPETDLHHAYLFEAPAAVRAMAAIHARFGNLPWRQVIGPAEALARFGFRLSGAFVSDWRAAGPQDAAAQAIYGHTPAVGNSVRNLDLAGLLGQIRLTGAGAFYSGPAAQQVWSAASARGIPIDQAAWRGSLPKVMDSPRFELDDHQIVFGAYPGTPGDDQAALWPELEDRGPAELATLSAQLRLVRPDDTLQETAFVAADSQGGGAACTITMGHPFGTGQMAAGIFMASPAMPSAAPVLVTNTYTRKLLAAIAGSGTPGLQSAIALDTLDEEKPLAAAVDAPRAFLSHDGSWLTEPGASHPPGPSRNVNSLGRVNAIVCTGGLPQDPDSCAADADRRGQGYAAVAGPAS